MSLNRYSPVCSGVLKTHEPSLLKVRSLAEKVYSSAVDETKKTEALLAVLARIASFPAVASIFVAFRSFDVHISAKKANRHMIRL